MITASLSAAGKAGASPNDKLNQARALLREAVALLDSIHAPPEYAARVQAALDALSEYHVDEA
jgi:hypothetical protein